MFTKNQIDNWISLYSLSDNKKDFVPEEFKSRPFLKRDLIEAKVQIDRWDAVTNTWIFHSSKREMIENLFPEDKMDATGLKDALQTLIKYAMAYKLNKNISQLTPEELAHSKTMNERFSIWGADVYFSDDIATDTAVGLALNKDKVSLMRNDSGNLTNSIIVFNVP